MDTGAVKRNITMMTEIMVVMATKSTTIMVMVVGMMTGIARLCMAGMRTIGETYRQDSRKRIDCHLAWNDSWNFGAHYRPV
jgi:hypothetical protein